jgi:hypothetical protein
VFTQTQIEVLRYLYAKPLPDEPTITEAMWALAFIRGHDSRRTRPGWRVLGEAYEKLLAVELGWIAARSSKM